MKEEMNEWKATWNREKEEIEDWEKNWTKKVKGEIEKMEKIKINEEEQYQGQTENG